MKFGQLIEYKMRNIFLKNPYTKYGTETIPRIFAENSQNWENLRFYAVCFYIMGSWGLS